MSRFLLRVLLATFCLATLPTAIVAAPKKLIEMGWDEPDPAFMRQHLDQLERSPFDGCIYHLMYARRDTSPGNFTWEAWGARAFTESDVDSGLRDLQATPFRRMHWNFLRINVTPGRIDWFDDYSSVLSNLRLAASVARRGGSAGVMLDTENYEGHLFEFAAQRDTTARTFTAYSEQARRRGAQVMQALERGYPGLTVFLTMGATYPYIHWRGDRIPPKLDSYGLLAPFVDGMIQAASDSARIVDGMEGSYPVRDPQKLDLYLDFETNGVLTLLSDSTKYRHTVSRSIAIWLDYDWRHRGWNAKDASKNYRSADSLRSVVRRALELADDYVWVYGEKPRWWTAGGGRRDLPDAYVQALWNARKGLAP